MKMPKTGSRRHKIVMNFIESGGLTIPDFIEKYTMMGVPNMGDFKNEISELRCAGILKRVGDVYSYNGQIDNPTYTKGEIVPSRTPKEFTQISAKYLMPKVSPRGQELRDITFVNLGASIAAPNKFYG